ncbi:sugar phosphate nucleotidyltransferase [Salinarimonas chemoclinalis]|uniref:sugar phosphate nucleotidyltransferase n=1 Tax=Salinarimonas chemoclinalis TaxID=3241599 RepID=UPI0035590F9A
MWTSQTPSAPFAPIGGDERALPGDVVTAIEAEEERRRAQRGDGGARTVLVVGGGGYVGIPVIEHLLARGYRVRNLDLGVYRNGPASMGLAAREGYAFLHGDFGDREVVARALEGVSDVVVLGGLVGDPITKKFPDESAAINERGMLSFIAALDGRALNKVIFVSTCSNYGMISEDRIADESFELRPLSLYAKAKVGIERHLGSLRGEVDYDVTILRFSTAFGLAPRMRFDLTVNEFTRELFLGRELAVYDATTWRPYCHVRDFARVIDRVLRMPRETVSFETFNVGADRNNHTKRSIVELIRQRLPQARVTEVSASNDPRNYRVSFAKMRDTLMIEPIHSVEDGIDEILEALSNRVFEDVEERRDFYGNYALPGLRGGAAAIARGTAGKPRAVILAGGKGVRLRPYTASLPKPLVPLGDKPILELVLHQLAACGFGRATLTLGHLSGLIRAFVDQQASLRAKIDIDFVDEEAPTGTAGSLASVGGLDEPFLVMNGDVLTDIDYGAVLRDHAASGAALTIAAHNRSIKIDLGVLEVDDGGNVVGYREKPEMSHDVSMGIYAYSPRVLAHIRAGEYLDFPDLVLRLIAAGETVRVYRNDAMWLDIGRPEDYARAQELVETRAADLNLGAA